jgi:hypothetical protein
VYIKFTARDAFLELPLSGTLKIKRLESQIIKGLGAKKPKGLGGILVFKGIIRSVVSVSTLTWFIRYIYYCDLQFLINLNVKKTKVLLPLP